MSWRTIAIVLAIVCAWQTYRSVTRPAIDATTACHEPDDATPSARSSTSERRITRATDTAAPASSSGAFLGIPLPANVRTFLPQPNENLRAYRDRMMPLAQMAVAPQRDRLARSVEDLSRVAQLDPAQREALQTTTAETAEAMQDRVFDAVLSGELSPSTFKPMAGVKVARDVLDILERGNQAFVGSLREDQRAALAGHPFDFADYLVFSTKWEDTINRL